MFNYKGINSNFDYKVGVIEAKDENEAIEAIRREEDIIIIVSLTKASSNRIVNNFQSTMRERMTSIQNRFKRNKPKRKPVKSIDDTESDFKKSEQKETIFDKSPILRMFKRSDKRRQSRSTDSERITDRSPILKVIKKVVPVGSTEHTEEVENYEGYSELSYNYNEEEVKIARPTKKKEDTKGRAINWDLLDVDEVSEEIKANNKLKVQDKDILMFTRKLHIMLTSGVSLLSALSLLHEMDETDMGVVVGGILDEIKMGSSLSEAMSKYPKIFDNSYVSLISIGETSGNLDDSLVDIIRMKEHGQKIFKKVKMASIYPSIVGAVLAVMMVFMSMFFLPKFEEMYQDQGLGVPLFTEVVFGIANVAPFIGLGVIAFVVIFIIMRRKIPKVNQFYFGVRDKLLLKVPIVKEVTNALYMYSFSYTVSLMLKNGIRLSDTLSLAGRSINNIYIKNQVEHISELMSYGLSFSEAMREQENFDDILINITLTGEESGQMDESLAKVADYYNDELSNKVDALMEIIPPASIVLIAVIAAPVVIAAYLPILEISSGGGL